MSNVAATADRVSTPLPGFARSPFAPRAVVQPNRGNERNWHAQQVIHADCRRGSGNRSKHPPVSPGRRTRGRIAAAKGAATVRRHKEERRANLLAQIREQIATGTLVVRHMPITPSGAAGAD